VSIRRRTIFGSFSTARVSLIIDRLSRLSDDPFVVYDVTKFLEEVHHKHLFLIQLVSHTLIAPLEATK